MREKLTVVLFKDHLTSRTLKLPLHWLPRLGIFWLIAMLLTLFSAGLFIRGFFRTTDGTSSFTAMQAQEKADELEKQLAELKASYDALQARTQGGTTTDVSTGTPTGANFSALPITATKNPLPPRDKLPFRLESLKAQWRGNSLQLNTAIEYIRDDGGNQSGHFVIVARGPQSLYVYPDGAFTAAGTESLIRPESGEYFSVSRYREVRATFGPVASRDAIRSIEVFVFGPEKTLVYYDRAGVEAPKPKPTSETLPRPVTPKPEAPAASSTEAPAAPEAAPEAPAGATAPAESGATQ